MKKYALAFIGFTVVYYMTGNAIIGCFGAMAALLMDFTLNSKQIRKWRGY